MMMTSNNGGREREEECQSLSMETYETDRKSRFVLMIVSSIVGGLILIAGTVIGIVVWRDRRKSKGGR